MVIGGRDDAVLDSLKMADSIEDGSGESTSKKRKTRKAKMQNFIIGRTRRRINSENSMTLAATRAKFVNAGSISVEGTFICLAC